ncbi:hypothetical protein KI387_002248, partial [Taxus chinensis]
GRGRTGLELGRSHHRMWFVMLKGAFRNVEELFSERRGLGRLPCCPQRGFGVVILDEAASCCRRRVTSTFIGC